MTRPRRPPSLILRVTRGLAVITFLALIASSALAVVRWDVVWGAVPGRISGPVPAIDLTGVTTIENPEVRLAVLGDVGTGDAAEWATAGLVAAAAEPAPFDGLVLLGDNVYPDGDPARLDATVFEPFEPVLDRGTALLAVLGNHDVHGDHAQGQVEALGMPGRWYATDIGPARVIVLDSNLVGDPAQTRWLEATLADQSAAWTIVALHHPPYSAGYHGSAGDVREAWVPIFERYGVDLVLAGHDHDYQRSTPINGVVYVVSGGGAKIRATDTASFSAFAAAVRHFVAVAATEDRLELTAIGEGGPFDHVSIVAGATPKVTAVLGSADGGSNVAVARKTLVVGAMGAAIWVSVLLLGWYGPPRVVRRRQATVLAGTAVGMTTTLAGFGATLVVALA